MSQSSPKQFVEEQRVIIKEAIKRYGKFRILDKNGNKKKVLPSYLLTGAPGLGKSACIYNLAKALEDDFRAEGIEKKVNVIDIRLLLMTPTDLRGIPTSDNEKKSAVWLKPQILEFDPSDNVINLVILEELASANLSMMNTALQLVHDYRIGEHEIPDNVWMVCTGNRQEDACGASKLTTNLANRLSILDFGSSADYREWREWAMTNEVDQRIIAFLGFKPDLLMQFNPKSKNSQFPSPRSWENASDIMKLCGDNVEMAFASVAGLVGDGAASEFLAYTKVYSELPSLIDIASGKYTEAVKRPDLCSALITGITMNLVKMSPQQIMNCIRFIGNMPAEFSTLAVKDMITNPQVMPKVINLKEFKDLQEKVRKYLI
jgi:DNA polymerase III delta prime subunit